MKHEWLEPHLIAEAASHEILTRAHPLLPLFLSVLLSLSLSLSGPFRPNYRPMGFTEKRVCDSNNMHKQYSQTSTSCVLLCFSRFLFLLSKQQLQRKESIIQKEGIIICKIKV